MRIDLDFSLVILEKQSAYSDFHGSAGVTREKLNAGENIGNFKG